MTVDDAKLFNPGGSLGLAKWCQAEVFKQRKDVKISPGNENDCDAILSYKHIINMIEIAFMEAGWMLHATFIKMYPMR